MRGRQDSIVMGVVVLVQMILIFLVQKPTVIETDGIFSYTLSNNPYTYLFIDDIYEEFPNNNGWLDAHILRENYVVEKYDRFNYSAVYHHQRHDVHPPLYYFAVHTLSSLFPGTYSNFYTLGINLLALLLMDFVLMKLCGFLYGRSVYAVVPIAVLMSMRTISFLLNWPRMYMMLLFFCLWYLYLHAKLLIQDWNNKELVELAVCIFGGTLTHYYFYIYAAGLALLTAFYLIGRKKRNVLLRYVYSGSAGVMVSWIFYPWVLFHIFGNQQQKHTNIEWWTLEKGKEYLSFLNEKLFHGRVWAWLLLLLLLGIDAAVFKRSEEEKQEKEKKQRLFRKMVIGSGMLYSLVIYTLDGDVLYYSAVLYMAFAVWVSMVLLDLSGGGYKGLVENSGFKDWRVCYLYRNAVFGECDEFLFAESGNGG